MNVSLIAWVWPEVKRFEKATERKEAVRYATQGMYFNGYYLVSLIVLVVVLVQLRLNIEDFLDPSPLMQLALAGVVGGLGGACAVGGALLFSRKRIRTRLRERLNAAGIRVCMTCGYSLIGLAGCCCPECGLPYARVGQRIRGV